MFPTSTRQRLPALGGLFKLLACGLLLAGGGHAVDLVAQEDSQSLDSGGASSIPRAQTDPDYKLSSGDLIVVEMFNQPEISTSQRLTATGEIRLPMIGRVALLDLTVREAEMRIETMYTEGGFFVNPQIILFVQQYAERFVSVLGQVRTPSRIPLPEESNSLGILQAVTLAGGFTRIARTDSVQVLRTNSDGVEERFEIDVRELLSSRRSKDTREFQLIAGDVVLVPERTI